MLVNWHLKRVQTDTHEHVEEPLRQSTKRRFAEVVQVSKGSLGGLDRLISSHRVALITPVYHSWHWSGIELCFSTQVDKVDSGKAT